MSGEMMTPEQAMKIAIAISERLPKLTYEEAESVLNAKATLAQGVAAAFEPFIAPKHEPVCDTTLVDAVYRLIVPYNGDKTIQELITVGQYDWANEDVSDEHFPNVQHQDVEVDLELFNFDRRISTDEVLSFFGEEGLVAANAAELLALGNLDHRLQKKFPLVALGQKWKFSKHNSFVLCLAWHGLLRRIYLLTQHKREWPPHTRFVAKRI